MIIVQSEAATIAVENLEDPPEIPRIEVGIAENDANDTEQEIRQDVDRGNRISIISDTDYNASAESNNSSRTSSIDVPHFQLSLLRQNGNHRSCNNGEQSEVGRLSSEMLAVDVQFVCVCVFHSPIFVCLYHSRILLFLL